MPIESSPPRKRGRPPLPNAHRKSITVGIRLTPGDYITLHELAAAKGESVTTLLRIAIERFVASRNAHA